MYRRKSIFETYSLEEIRVYHQDGGGVGGWQKADVALGSSRKSHPNPQTGGREGPGDGTRLLKP